MKAHSTRLATILTAPSKALVLGLMNLALVSPAMGQTTTLPLPVIEGASLGGSQISQITSFADHWTARALDSDLQTASRAQTKLMEPLVNSRVSIAFRRAYSDALGSYFDTLQNDGSVGATLSMLRLAGELGTTRSTQIVLSGLDSDDAGVRIFALGRAGRTFRTTTTNGPALTANDLTSLVSKVSQISASSNDQSVLSAAFQALGQGCALPSKDFLVARTQCMIAMCSAASTQLTADSTDLETRTRLAMQSSGAATNSLLQVGEGSSNEAIKAAVALGGDMISIALSNVVDGTMPGLENRGLQTTLVRTGESLLYFSLRKHAELNGRPVGSVEQTQLAVLLEAGEDRDFRNKAALLLGAGSPIIKAFNFPDDRFVH